MELKFVIFVFISAFLMAAIYSSFAFVQFAFSVEESCAFSPDKKRHICIGVLDDTIYLVNCTVDSIGEWYCDIEHLTREFSLPGALKEALDKAEIAELQANTTDVNDTNIFDRLSDLTVMNEQSIDSNDNNDEERIDSNEDLGDLNDNGDGPTTSPED